MPQAATNRAKLAFVQEATFDTTPATPAMRALRYTSASLGMEPGTKISDEIISDRNVSDLILLQEVVNGEFGYEMSHLAPDLLYQGALFNPWVKTAERLNESTTQISAVAATTYTVTGSENFRQYQLINATGFTNPANNKVFVAGVATSSVSLVHSGGTVEASPPLTARVKVAGLEGPTGDLVATANGLTSTLINFTQFGLAVGQWVYVGGNTTVNQFATAACKGWCRISVIAAGALTFDRTPAGWTTDTGTAKLIRLYFGDYLRNGTTPYSYTFEQSYLDISQFQYSRGCRINQLTIEARANSILTAKMAVMGAGFSYSGSRFAGATDLNAPAYEVLQAASNLGNLSVNGSLLTDPNYPMSLSLQVNNNLRPLMAIGSKTALNQNAGRCVVTGTLEAYFGNLDLVNFLINNTAVGFDFATVDASGYGMHLDLPRIKFTSGKPSVPGSDQEIMLPLGMQALKHPSLGYAMQMQRVEVLGA